ncbi:MAG: cache domain-containing protein [Magnetococcales bacterium]|nr:cache domain-containing protein [Magnetococcales bacterium]
MRAFFSSIFGRLFTVVTGVVLLYFGSIHFVLVPVIRDTLAREKEAMALTLLETVVEILHKTKAELDNYRTFTLEARKKELKDVVTLTGNYLIRELSTRIASGRTEQQARSELFEMLRHFQYGDRDYFFLIDDRSQLLSHPDPKLHGSDYSQARDVNDQLIVPPMVEIAKRDGEGFHTYWFNRLGRLIPSEKISFVRYLPELNALLGSGLYLDDVADMVAMRKVKTFSALREKLKQFRIAKTGYVFIFDSQNQVIAHPSPLMEGEYIHDRVDPISGQLLTARLKQGVESREGIRFRWSQTDDPDRHADEMIAWVRHFQDYDWYVATSIHLKDLYADSELMARQLRWFAGVVLMLALAVGYWSVRRLTAPLHALALCAQQVERGDPDARCLVETRQDEIGVLVQGFNAMVERLQTSIRTLDDKVRERTRALEQAVAELRELDRLKSNFISSVSHELRTPLTAILGFAKLLSRTLERLLAIQPGENPEQYGKILARARENVTTIADESMRLAKRIDAVLDLTQLEAGQITLQQQTMRPAGLLQECVAYWQPSCQAKGIGLRLDDHSGNGEFHADPARLRQILDNLLDNAVKFTQAGEIVVTADCVDDRLRIVVQDTGPGVPLEYRALIFEKFNQAGEILVDKPTGIGLGLPIGRILAGMHGGTLDLTASTFGARFVLQLPLHASPPNDIPVA